MYLIGFQLFITQNFRPCAFKQRDFVLFGKLLIKQMIAQMTEQCTDTQVRYAHQDGGDIFLLHAFDDFGDIVTGFGFGQFAQEIVTLAVG